MVKHPSKVYNHGTGTGWEGRIILIGLPSYGLPPHIKPQGWTSNIVKSYMADTKYPYPRSHDFSYWKYNGIIVEPYTGMNTWMGLRKLYHTVKVPHVVCLIGRQARKLLPAIHGSNDHLVIACNFPAPSRQDSPDSFINARIFSRACDFINQPRDIWRLP